MMSPEFIQSVAVLVRTLLDKALDLVNAILGVQMLSIPGILLTLESVLEVLLPLVRIVDVLCELSVLSYAL